MVTPQLFYRLCAVQGSCLAVVTLVPQMAMAFAGYASIWSFQLSVASFLASWTLLTLGTGLAMLHAIQRQAGDERPFLTLANLRRWQRRFAALHKEATIADSPQGQTPPPRPTLRLFNDEDDAASEPIDTNWKSQWRRASGQLEV